jgi:hypothetical protein
MSVTTVPPIFESRISAEGKAILYAVASDGEVASFRQALDEKSQPQRVIKLPFAFQQSYGGNVRLLKGPLDNGLSPGGHADHYYLSQR